VTTCPKVRIFSSHMCNGISYVHQKAECQTLEARMVLNVEFNV